MRFFDEHVHVSKMQMNMLRPPLSNTPLGLVRLQFSIQTPKLHH